MPNLQVNFTDTATKAVIPAAYVLIAYVMIDGIAQTIDVCLYIYASAAARAAGGTPQSVYHAWPPFASIMSGPINIPVALMTYVKGLAPFAGGVDVA